jgi:hypothetical protein
MTDPADALQSFQQAFERGEIRVRAGTVDPHLHLFADESDGQSRLTYVRLDGKTVTAIVIFAACAAIDGRPCFAIGYAVPEGYRNQGRAKEAIRAALAEMQYGFGRIFPVFYVEAIVGADNKASQRVAEETISDTPTAVTDQVSGQPVFQYVRKIERVAA